MPSAFAQNAEESKPTGFEWLKQFEGTWAVLSEPNEGSGEGTKGMMTSKLLGKQWLVNEHTANVNGAEFKAIQSIQYDAKTDTFSGKWIDSMAAHKWKYSGKLDSSGKKILLESEGPDWGDSSKMRPYRDVYEF